MRRFVAAVAVTIIGLYLTLSYKSSSPTSRVGAPSATVPSDGATAAPTAPPDNASVPGASPPTTGNAGPTTTAPAASSATRTINGDVVPNRYGDVQVAVVLSGKRIVDVQPLQLPFDRSRSKYISDNAAPILRQEVLDAQSAQIDTVSGATYTSDGYAQSLQSALDRA
ncbi:MAG TPA: FMN-binding protein [Acidimicrobiales bacterium]|nr:FMN-binding protein [Acidimicrobiales bacterium]